MFLLLHRFSSGASCDPAEVQDGDDDDDEEDDEGEWIVQQTTRPRMQQNKDLNSLGQTRSESHSPTPRCRNSGKP